MLSLNLYHKVCLCVEILACVYQELQLKIKLFRSAVENENGVLQRSAFPKAFQYHVDYGSELLKLAKNYFSTCIRLVQGWNFLNVIILNISHFTTLPIGLQNKSFRPRLLEQPYSI